MIGLLTILLFIVRVNAQGANSHNCQQLENAVQMVCGETEYGTSAIQGPPGKKGIQGERGAAGPVGPRGPAGVVDYERINVEVERKVTERVGALAEQTRNINERMEELYAIVKAGNCDVEYNGKCFHAVTRATQDVNFAQGKLLCERIGWKLANIYDLTHYQLIEKYLRPKVMTGNTAVKAWLGMTYVANKEVLLSSGRQIDLRGLKWYPTYPQANPSYTKMGIYFHTEAKHGNQGIYNYPANFNRQGALCEI